MLNQAQIDARYAAIMDACRRIFDAKGNAYGPTWAAFRWVSLCDQLWIKIKRIRQLEERESMVDESAEGEYIALINYAVIFLMRLRDAGLNAGEDTLLEDMARIEALGREALLARYDRVSADALALCRRKNHDYNNAWQEMALPAITDMIVVKVLRLKHILAAAPAPGAADLSEQLYDIINYSVFALIVLGGA